MESFSEGEKKAILGEIQRIRRVLHDDVEHSNDPMYFSSDDSSVEEYSSASDYVYDEEEQEEDDFSFMKARSSASWQAVDEEESDSSSYEKDYLSNVAQKAQASVEQDALHKLSTSGLYLEQPFVRNQSSVVDKDNLDVSATPKENVIPDATTGDAKSDNLEDALDTNDIDIGLLERALQLNRQYQVIVTDELMKIDTALRNNKGMQAEIESRSSGSKNPNMLGYSFLGRFKPTYFKDLFGQGPPDNEDSKKRNALKAVHPFITPQKAWKESERLLLAEGVRKQNLEKITLELNQNLKKLKAMREGDNSSNVQKEIKAVEQRLEDVQKIPPEELEMNLKDLDFSSISRLYLPERTEKECRVRWLKLEHPAINHSNWTKKEIVKLQSLAKKYKNRHWEKIAEELGTRRTSVQCFQYFQRYINKTHSKSPWTKEEDEQLLHAVKVCTKGNWLQISSMVEGKTPTQCLNRYDKCLKPGLRKGQWTKEENELLLKYVEIYGPGQWKKISEHIPGRSDTAVRERNSAGAHEG